LWSKLQVGIECLFQMTQRPGQTVIHGWPGAAHNAGHVRWSFSPPEQQLDDVSEVFGQFIDCFSDSLGMF